MQTFRSSSVPLMKLSIAIVMLRLTVVDGTAWPAAALRRKAENESYIQGPLFILLYFNF